MFRVRARVLGVSFRFRVRARVLGVSFRFRVRASVRVHRPATTVPGTTIETVEGGNVLNIYYY